MSYIKQLRKHGWSVKNVKTFTGMEGPGFNASLYLNGKKVGFSYDDATGGPITVDWSDPGAKAKMDALVNELPPHYDEDLDHTFEPQVEFLISDLVEEYLNDQRLKRHCRTKILFRCEGDDDSAWRTIGGAWNAKNKATLEERYAKKGTPIKEFFNERFGAAK